MRVNPLLSHDDGIRVEMLTEIPGKEIVIPNTLGACFADIRDKPWLVLTLGRREEESEAEAECELSVFLLRPFIFRELMVELLVAAGSKEAPIYTLMLASATEEARARLGR